MLRWWVGARDSWR